MHQLRDSISMLTKHSAQCSGKCTLEGENVHSGLAVIKQASCIKCGQVSIRMSPRTEPAIKAVDSQLGCSSQGNGDWRWVDMLELHACNIGNPWHEQVAVFSHQRIPWKEMQQNLACSMQQVAEEHAIAMNSFYQGVPSITVVVDGGWSKRAHKHSYNAKNGSDLWESLPIASVHRSA